MAEVLGRGNDMDFEAGKPHVQRALALDPDCYEANLFAGYIHLGQRQYEQAIVHFEKALDIDPLAYSPAGMVVQAYDALNDEEKSRAAARRCIARCEKLLAAEPDHASALGFFVTSLADLGDKERALTWARRAVIFHLDNVRLRYNLVCALIRISELDEAFALLK